MSTDFFAHKAGSYEQIPSRVDNVDSIAQAIIGTISLDPGWHLLDFGSGTGLLLERLAPLVDRITAVDVSPAMNRQLEAKLGHLPCAVDIVAMDLSTASLDRQFNGIVSSMTMHHIADIGAMFEKFHAMLKPGGFIAIADLDSEDGSFHSEDTGVHHFGFERAAIAAAATAAGFGAAQVGSASCIHKPQGDYGVFLLTAYKR